MQKSHLTRLAESHRIIDESSTTKKFSTICGWLTKPGIIQEAAASYTCASLSRVTMCHYNILWVLFEPFIHFIYNLKQQMKWWSMMILKDKVANSILESFFRIFCWANVKNPIFPFVMPIKKCFNVCPFVPPECFDSRSRKTHDNDAILADVGKINIKTFILHSSSWSANFLL